MLKQSHKRDKVVLGECLRLSVLLLFHHQHHQRAEKVKFRAENVFLLPGTSSGQ